MLGAGEPVFRTSDGDDELFLNPARIVLSLAGGEEHRALARNLLEGVAKALARRLRHTNTEVRAMEE